MDPRHSAYPSSLEVLSDVYNEATARPLWIAHFALAIILKAFLALPGKVFVPHHATPRAAAESLPDLPDCL
jgi:hypothetical protein